MARRTLAAVIFLLAAAAALLPLRSDAQVSNQVVYDNQIENGWQNWSWATVNLSSTKVYPSGYTHSIAVTAGAYQALWLHSASDFNDSAYTSIQFQICGGAAGATGGQKLAVQATLGNNPQTAYTLTPLPGNGAWATYTIPLSSLGAMNATNFDGFWIQDTTGASQATFYVGAVTLISDTSPPPAATVTIDASANTHPINPLIYGVAYGTTAQLQDLNAPFNRFGGNATSQYNWQLNAANKGSDWYFESIADSPATAGGDGDSYVSESEVAGSQAALTIPTIGWVANLCANRSSLDSFSVAKYGKQQYTDPYWADAGNGVLSSGANVVNNPNDANIPANVAFQQGWVNHLLSTWGNSANGGVKYYIMDNEPSLWQNTHRDVHPTGPTMTEVANDIASYGAMVKAADTNALILGPEEWGWSGYFYSGYDQQYGNQHGWSGSMPDQAAHGGMYYMPWLLQQMQSVATQTGTRTLDYFTLHFYPQGGEFSSDDSAGTDLLRNRSTRQLWDPNYVSESWIASCGQNGGVVELIPLMKSWVNSYYPGTKVGIDEYNWGDEDAMNGATTQADIEGIFGQQGLDMAARWGVPDPSGPAYQAMKIYRNYDGNKSTFGDTSISDVAPDPDNLSSFAAVRSSDGALTIVVDNKWLAGANTPVTLSIANFSGAASAHVWQLAAPGNSIVQLADAPISNGTITFSAAPQTVTLFVVPAAQSAGPTISSLSPSTQPAGGAATTLTVNGSNFVSTSVVNWNSSALTTTYVSSGVLTAIVPQSDVQTAGSESVTVTNASATSNAATFTLTSPLTVQSVALNANSCVGGQADSGVVTFSGTAPAGGLVVQLSSSNSSVASVASSVTVAAGATTGSFNIATSAVTNSTNVTITATANGSPATATLTVCPVVPALSSLSPSTASAGSAATTLTVSGSNFLSSSVVNWNGAPLSTAYVSSGVLTATVPQSDLQSAGSDLVTVTNGSATSNSATFTVSSPITIQSLVLTLNSCTGGQADCGQLTFTGAVPNGGLVVALSSSNTSVASLVPSMTVAAGSTTASFAISTSAVTSSNSVTITATANGVPVMATLIVAPAGPAVTSLSPSTLPAGGLPVNLTVTGSNFVSTSVVNWNGTALATTYKSASRLVAIVTEADLRYPGPALVTVTNGATSSNPATFTLTNTINIQSFTLKTASCQGGKGDSGLLTFTGAIPTGGQVVKLLSSNPAVAGVATSLTIAGGSTTRSFYITTVAVPSPTVVTITATTNGVSAVATLTVMPASVKSISLSSHSVTGGSETMAMVTMTGMVAEGTVVKLSSTGSGAVMPDSIKVALGSKSAMFVVRTVKVTTKQKVTIKADTDGAPCSTILTIN